MKLETDSTGDVVIQATGEQGRVVLLLANGRTLIVTEQNDQIFTTDNGRTDSPFNAGKTAGIVKNGLKILALALLLNGCCTQPKPVTIYFDASEERR